MEFTPRAERSFRLAQAEAHSLGHRAVGSQHLVLGLILLGDGVQFAVLQGLGCTADSVRRNIVAIGPLTEDTQKIEGHQFGASAARAVQRAGEEARAMTHTYVGTEHILLGLLSEESGPAATLFLTQGMDTARARNMILDEYRHV
jgi:ATP-dependent Clp protease ATP-binding subunit ClpC